MQRTQYGVHPPPAEDNIYEYASPDICMQHTTAQLLQPMFLSKINTVCFNEQVKLAACPSVLGGYLIMGKLRRGWLPAAGCCLGAELCGPAGSAAPRPTLLQPVLGHQQHQHSQFGGRARWCSGSPLLLLLLGHVVGQRMSASPSCQCSCCSDLLPLPCDRW